MQNYLSNCFIKILVMFTGVIWYMMANAADNSETLHQAQWNVPRSATTIVNMTPVQKTIRKYQAQAGARIQIRYAGGDEGTLWVRELRSWLVSLGIPSTDIELIPGASDPTQLELSVINPVKTSRQNQPGVQTQ